MKDILPELATTNHAKLLGKSVAQCHALKICVGYDTQQLPQNFSSKAVKMAKLQTFQLS